MSHRAARSPAGWRRPAALWLAAAAVSGFTLRRYVGPLDEGILMQAATRMGEGQWPWRDFSWAYGPGQPLLVLVAGKLLGPSLLWWRLLRVAADATAAVLVWALVRDARPQSTRWPLVAWAGAAVTAAQPVNANPAAVALALALAAVLLAARGHPAWAGAAAAAATFWRPDIGACAAVAAVVTASLAATRELGVGRAAAPGGGGGAAEAGGHGGGGGAAEAGGHGGGGGAAEAGGHGGGGGAAEAGGHGGGGGAAEAGGHGGGGGAAEAGGHGGGGGAAEAGGHDGGGGAAGGGGQCGGAAGGRLAGGRGTGVAGGGGGSDRRGPTGAAGRAAVACVIAALVTGVALYLPFIAAAGPGGVWDALVVQSGRDGAWWRLPFPGGYDGRLRAWPPWSAAGDLKDLAGWLAPYAALAGLAVAALTLGRRRLRDVPPAAAGLLVLGLGSFAYFVSRADPEHAQPLLVVACALGAIAAAAAPAPLRLALGAVVGLVLAVGVANRASALLRPPDLAPLRVPGAGGARVPPADAAALPRVVALVQRLVPPGEPIYVAPRRSDLVTRSDPLLHFLTRRPNVLRRDVLLQAKPAEQARIVAALRAARPRAVIRWTDPASSAPEPNRRGRPSGSRVLDAHLASAYRLEARFGAYDVLVPRSL